MSSPITSNGAAPADWAVLLEGVSVCYRLQSEKTSFKEHAIRWLKGSLAISEFWALQGVALEIKRGEVFGIIGRNGAGKSTLLKVLSRVLRPTKGRVRVAGRVAPLLELGAGFDPELTGRENVFFNGSILGHSQGEIAERLDRIIEFAGLGDFIDRPLRSYSTGMVVRLGFAVATAVRPEVLIVDEVLGVGDAEFQAKSSQRINDFHKSGTTIIMVTHELSSVSRLCQRAAWLSGGQVQAVGPAGEIVGRYQDSVAAGAAR